MSIWIQESKVGDDEGHACSLDLAVTSLGGRDSAGGGGGGNVFTVGSVSKTKHEKTWRNGGTNPLKLLRKLVSEEEKVPELPKALLTQLRPMKELQTLPEPGTVKYLPVAPASMTVATFWKMFLCFESVYV